MKEGKSHFITISTS